MAALALRQTHRVWTWQRRLSACTAMALLSYGAGPLASAAYAAEPSPGSAAPPPPRQAIGVQVGRFTYGKYAPNANNNFSTCTAITFCSEKGLFGTNLSLTYTRRLWSGGSSHLDADLGVAIAEQAVQLNQGRVAAISGGPSTTVALFTVVPTYRLRLPKPLKAVTLGAGLGFSLASAAVPAEQPYDIPLNTQFNLEIAVKPIQERSLEIVAALQHRCSFFGLLNQQDGRYSGSQWYSIGIRQWF